MNKKTKNLIVLFSVVLFVGGAVALAIAGFKSALPGTVSNAGYSAGALSTAENFFDFKTIKMGDGNVSHQFEVINKSDEPVVIEKVYTSCMCTTAYITDNSGARHGEFGMQGHASSRTNINVNAGESVILEAIFDPAAHGPSGVGFAERSIYLDTNSAEFPKLEFRLAATVVR